MTDESIAEAGKDDNELYPWAADLEEKRRSFVFEYMADADLAGDSLVKNMDIVLHWLKTGKLLGPSQKSSSSLTLTKIK